jgi:predicted anti-sigma-YlaC factor YlaD
MSLPSPADPCARARERASLNVDGELSLIEAVALQSHLRFCADCRSFAAGVERVAGELRAAALEVPEFRTTMRRFRHRPFVAFAPVAVATAAVAALLLQATPLAPSILPSGAPSNAATLHAAYAEQRLARLFLNGGLATRVQHTASLMN